MLKISSTSNVSLNELHEFALELSPVLNSEIDEGQYFYKSFDPPTWIKFIAEADWWAQALAAAAALYISELIKEAAKHTWKSSSNKVASKQSKENPIHLFSEKTIDLLDKLPINLNLYLAIPLPDEYNCTVLELESPNINDIAIQTALFIHHLPKLMKLIENELSKDDRVLGSFQLEILEDGSLKVFWKTMSFEQMERIISLPNAV